MAKNTLKKNLPVKLAKFDKKQFVLMIGDEGAVLTHMVDNKLQARLFATLSNAQELNKFSELLSSDPKAHVSMLVDVIDQSYVHQSLPGVGSFSIAKLVKKRLDRDYAATDLKGSIFTDRATTGREDWNFIFVAVPMAPPLSDWLNFILEQPNPLRAIYMLPIESGAIVANLDKIFFPAQTKSSIFAKKIAQQPKWQLFITHNKVGGFRQVAFKNGKIIFTRQISVPEDESPNFIAGNIEQEILNSFEYLKRLSLRDSDRLDIFIIVSKEIKNGLLKISLKASNVIILTPFEAAYKLKYYDIVLEEDKYGDVLLSVMFATNKDVLPFIPSAVKLLAVLQTISRWVYAPLAIISLLLIFYIPYVMHDTSSIKDEIVVLNQHKAEYALRYQEAKKVTGTIENANKISNVVSLYHLLAGNTQSPLQTIADFNAIKGDNILVKSIHWKLAENHNNSPAASSPPQLAAGNNSSIPKIRTTTIFSLELHNQDDSSYQKLFDEFDSFIKEIKSTFYEYEITYSKLTDKISFTSVEKTIPIEITITGAGR